MSTVGLIFSKKIFSLINGEEKGYPPEKWRKSEKNGESSNEFLGVFSL